LLQYNKWMFSSDHLDFHFPLFTTSLHMLVQFLLASLLLALIPSLRPYPIPNLSGPTKPLITPLFYFTRLVPCGATTSLDIGLGNTSLRYITLTFYTMCKSSVLGFVLLFAFLFRLESPNLKLILIIMVMIIGVTMMVAGETTFNALGFAFILSSSFFSGFRWALTQILLLRHPATSNPFATMFWLAPIMFMTLFLIALVSETPSAVLVGIHTLSSTHGAWKSAVLLIFPGTLAFCMTTAEFALLKRTSVVTLSICGIFKEVVTISAAGAVFGDALTPVNISGLIVTLTSIAAYNYLKITQMRSEAREKAESESRGAFKPLAANGSLEHEDFELDLSEDEEDHDPAHDGDDRLRRKLHGTSEHDPGERSTLEHIVK
jgi:solute carrier family 35 protein C2